MRCSCIRNTTNRVIEVKQGGGQFSTMLPPRTQLNDVDIDNFDELKNSGAYIKVNLTAVKESTGKQMLRD